MPSIVHRGCAPGVEVRIAACVEFFVRRYRLHSCSHTPHILFSECSWLYVIHPHTVIPPCGIKWSLCGHRKWYCTNLWHSDGKWSKGSGLFKIRGSLHEHSWNLLFIMWPCAIIQFIHPQPTPVTLHMHGFCAITVVNHKSDCVYKRSYTSVQPVHAAVLMM